MLAAREQTLSESQRPNAPWTRAAQHLPVHRAYSLPKMYSEGTRRRREIRSQIIEVESSDETAESARHIALPGSFWHRLFESAFKSCGRAYRLTRAAGPQRDPLRYQRRDKVAVRERLSVTRVRRVEVEDGGLDDAEEDLVMAQLSRGEPFAVLLDDELTRLCGTFVPSRS